MEMEGRMLTCSSSAHRAAAVLLGAGSLAVGCGFEAGTEPARENPPAMSSLSGQCLAPPSAAANPGPDFLASGPAGSTLIRARLASRLLLDRPAGEAFGSQGILCLAPEGARWVLRWEMEP